jgi:DNA-binding transcriptional regulator YdaS (Cro superfamily)
VKADMKVNYNTLRRKIDNCELLTVKDVKAMAKLFDVQEGSLFQIILSSVKVQPTVRRKTK